MFVAGVVSVLALAVPAWGQHESGPAQGNAGQMAPAGGVTSPSGNEATGSVGVTQAPATEADKTTAGPTTVRPTTSASDDNPYDPYLEPPPLPKGRTTLIGGTATSVDKVRNRVTIRPFGKGSKVKVVLDERSHIYRDGTETTILALKKGDRVYADTMLDGSKVLARNLRIETKTGPAEARGQITSADLSGGKISVRDELSSQAVSFSVNPATKYSASRGQASVSDLQPGSLIDVQFSPNRSDHDVAEEITILAKPGESFLFAGTITNLDMRSGTLALDNRSDDENYEIHFDPANVDKHDLKVGAEVRANTVFDGKAYRADNLQITEAPESKKEEKQSKVE